MKYTVTVTTETGDQYQTFLNVRNVEVNNGFLFVYDKEDLPSGIFPPHYWTKVVKDEA